MCPPLAGVLQSKLPVDQFVEHGINIVGTTILIIQVVSMLPHVNAKQWLHAGCQRDFGIGGLYHLELAAIEDKPGPTTPELRNGRAGEFLLAGVDTAEGCLDSLLECGGRFASSL